MYHGRAAYGAAYGGSGGAARRRVRAARWYTWKRLEQMHPSATPESVGLDSARLDVLTQWQRKMVAEGKLPHSEVLIARRGRVVYREHAGEQAPGTPLSDASRFRIYSMTKPIATTALMMLYEQGKFQLEDPVHFYLGQRWKKENMSVFVAPATAGGQHTLAPCEADITMRMMINHTVSGRM
jgi:CubicO group peptidase (beta-lactamase class C family)